MGRLAGVIAAAVAFWASLASASNSTSSSSVAPQPEGFVTAFWINTLITVVFFGILCLLWLKFPVSAHPRVYRFRSDAAASFPQAATSLSVAYPNREPTTFPSLLRACASPFAYAWSVAAYPRSQVLAVAGLDAVAMLALTELGLWFFGGVFVYGFIVQLPINYLNVGGDGSSGSLSRRDSSNVYSIGNWSLSNVTEGAAGLWSHAVSVWLYSGFLFFLIHRLLDWYVPLRYHWLASESSIARRTVLVRDIPSRLRSDRDFLRFARETYSPDEVVGTCLVTPAVTLQNAVAARNSAALAALRARNAFSKSRVTPEPPPERGWCGSRNAEQPLAPAAAAPADASSVAVEPTPTPRRLWKRPVMRDALCCGRRVDAFTLLESRVAKATATVTNLRETGYADPQERAKVAAKHMQATAARLAKRQQEQEQKSAAPPPLSAVVPTTPAPARWQGAGAAAAGASAAQAPRADPFRTDDLSWDRSVDSKAGRAGIYAPQAAGFVTFRSFETASAAAQTLAAALTGRARGMTVRPAPAPQDVLWANAAMPAELVTQRGRLAVLGATALTVFFTLLLSLLSAAVTLSRLAALLPGLGPVLQSSELTQSFISGMLPTIVVSVVVSLVPTFMAMLSFYGGASAQSELGHDVVKYMYVFNVWNIFLVWTIAGALWSSAQAIAQDPFSIVTVLAISLPNLSIYFTNWILLGISSAPLTMVINLVLRGVAVWWLKGGEGYPGEAKFIVGLTGWQSANFSLRIPVLLIMFTIALCYSSINPVICPIALVYFAVAHFANKHAALYEVEEAWQAGGSLLPAIISRLCFAAGLYQLIMIGLLALKLSAGPAALVAPLPFLTGVFWLYTKRVAAHTAHLPADFAAIPSQVTDYALHDSRRRLVASSASRLGHADLAPLAALALLRGAMSRWKERNDAKKEASAGPTSPSLLPPAEISETAVDSGMEASAAVSDVVLPPEPEVDVASAAVDSEASRRALASRRRAAAKEARKAAHAAELELARLSFLNPYVLPFFRPSDDQPYSGITEAELEGSEMAIKPEPLSA